jgi:hypothetical protein|tara:strand:+ start:610 stop:753 length:144 start_codon:yes stop_codon:yes gene_type:complete
VIGVTEFPTKTAKKEEEYFFVSEIFFKSQSESGCASLEKKIFLARKK